MSFGTIFWELGRYLGMILRYFGMKIKQTNFLLVQNRFSSKNNVPKYCNKGNEQVYVLG